MSLLMVGIVFVVSFHLSKADYLFGPETWEDGSTCCGWGTTANRGYIALQTGVDSGTGTRLYRAVEVLPATSISHDIDTTGYKDLKLTFAILRGGQYTDNTINTKCTVDTYDCDGLYQVYSASFVNLPLYTGDVTIDLSQNANDCSRFNVRFLNDGNDGSYTVECLIDNIALEGTKITANPTASPTTNEPTTTEPTTNVPTTNEPTTTEPTTNVPTTNEPTTNEPTTNVPTTNEPTTNEPTTNEPTTNVPTTNEPTTSNPTTLNGATTEQSSVLVYDEFESCVDMNILNGEGRLRIDIDVTNKQILINIDGPISKWFGVGFGSDKMLDTNAYIISEDSFDFVQRKLGNHNGGSIDIFIGTVISKTAIGIRRTVSILRDYNVDGQFDFTHFVECSDNLDIIWSIGADLNFGLHARKEHIIIVSCLCDDETTKNPTKTPISINDNNKSGSFRIKYKSLIILIFIIVVFTFL